MSVTDEYGEIYYLKETDEGTVVKHLKVVDFQVSQLNRIEEKLDKLLDLVGDKELSISIDGEKVVENIAKISAYDRFKSR